MAPFGGTRLGPYEILMSYAEGASDRPGLDSVNTGPPSDLTSRARQPETCGDVQKVTLDQALVVSKDRTSDPLALDDALQALAVFDPRKAQVIELRFLWRLSVEETAETRQVSADTVMRNWRLTKVWLLKELRGNR